MSGNQGQDTPPPLPREARRVAPNSLRPSDTKDSKKPGLLRRWFWSPLVSGENWAQTIFRVLGNLFRTATTLLVLLIGVSLTVNFMANENYERAAAKREAEKPENFVTVSIDQSFLNNANKDFADGCNKAYPFATNIYNGSNMAMTETWLVFSVRKKGTTDVLRFRGSNFEGGLSDRWMDTKEHFEESIKRIILPGSTTGWCWGFPPEGFWNFDPDASYIYQVELGANTTFVEAEGWMYEELGVTK